MYICKVFFERVWLEVPYEDRLELTWTLCPQWVQVTWLCQCIVFPWRNATVKLLCCWAGIMVRQAERDIHALISLTDANLMLCWVDLISFGNVTSMLVQRGISWSRFHPKSFVVSISSHTSECVRHDWGHGSVTDYRSLYQIHSYTFPPLPPEGWGCASYSFKHL